MTMLSKSFKVRADVWKHLRLNAEQSGVPLRDYLAFLIARSSPVPEGPTPDRRELEAMVAVNRLAGATAADLGRVAGPDPEGQAVA